MPPEKSFGLNDGPEAPYESSTVNKDPAVLAIVVTYNGEHFIERCLDCLTREVGAGDVVVIDNGSTDGTRKFIEERYPGITLVSLKANYGFGSANNLGLQMALARNADYVFLANQDVYIEENTIRELVRLAALYPSYGILSPMHLNGNGNALDKNFVLYVSSILMSDLYTGTLQPVVECPFVNAAAWLISKTCIETVGGFDPIFFHYGEDVDYSNRVKYFKMKIGVSPLARIKHDRGDGQGFFAYSQSKQIYLGVLMKLKDINVPFYGAAIAVSLQCAFEITSSILLLRFARILPLLSVFFKVVSRLNRILRARRISRQKRAFLMGNDHSLRPIVEKYVG